MHGEGNSRDQPVRVRCADTRQTFFGESNADFKSQTIGHRPINDIGE